MNMKLKQEKDNLCQYGVNAAINFQVHMIARVDDTCQVRIDNLQSHPTFPFALKTRLKWSKNVYDERDAPWQVILGSYETKFCVIVSLGLWLETLMMRFPYGRTTPYVFAFSEDTSIPGGANKSKNYVQRVFKKMMKE